MICAPVLLGCGAADPDVVVVIKVITVGAVVVGGVLDADLVEVHGGVVVIVPSTVVIVATIVVSLLFWSGG